MRLLVPATLVGFGVLLIGGIAYESFAPLDPVVVEVPRVRKTIADAPVPVFTPPPESDFADIDARPIFSPVRKPLADTTQPTATQTASSDFALAGVIMDQTHAVALIHSKSANTTTSAVLGDLVGGWHVVAIAPTAVTLRGIGGDAVIPLESPAARPAGAPLSTVPPPAASLPAPAETPSAPATPSAAASPAVTTAATTSPVPPAPAKPRSLAPPPAAKPGQGHIAPEALRGAPIDPQTGEPTL